MELERSKSGIKRSKDLQNPAEDSAMNRGNIAMVPIESLLWQAGRSKSRYGMIYQMHVCKLLQ
jgi:hypothetical protein